MLRVRFKGRCRIHGKFWDEHHYLMILYHLGLKINSIYNAGLATLGGGPPLELEVESLLSHAFNGAIYVSQSLLVFLFAAVSLDYCIKLRILSSFPIERSGSSNTIE